MRCVVCRFLCTSTRCRSHGGVVGKMRGGGGEKGEGERYERCEGCERRSECLGTHENRYHLSNEALDLNGLGGHREMRVKGI